MENLLLLSQRIGSGNLALDTALICSALTLICIVVTLVVATRTRSRPPDEASFERPMAGRIEKLDLTLSEFRAEVMRWIETSRKELGFIKHDLGQVRNLLSERVLNAEAQTASEPFERVPSDLPAGEKKNILADQNTEAAFAPADAEEGSQAPVTLALRLKKTRTGLLERLRGVFASKPRLDESALSELEALLIGADLGARLVLSLVEEVRAECTSGRPLDEQGFTALLKMKILSILEKGAALDSSIKPLRRDGQPLIVMVVGVNGVGKTTTIAKLAAQWKSQGAEVLVAAADTFRAAAVAQLAEWAKRINVPIIVGTEGAKPATVVFDAMATAKQGRYDAVIIDTAGRVHTKSNLMQELQGIRSVIERHQPGAPHEVILVVDGSTGQNAISQAREFNNAVPLTGVIVTKLDGTPKGGVVVAIKDELGIAVRYIGVGEGLKDLRPFVARDFVEALFQGGSAAPAESARSL